MENLKDSYTESRGRVFVPILYTDDYVYMRSEFHGHVELRMVRRDPDTGEVSLRRAAKFTPGFHNPRAWLMEHSEGMPKDFVPSGTRALLKTCNPACQEAQDKARKDYLARMTELKLNGDNDSYIKLNAEWNAEQDNINTEGSE